MDTRNAISLTLANVGEVLLGCVLNIFYPNSIAINGLLPNFLLIFSMGIILKEDFFSFLPILIFGGIVDSLWRGINPGINVLSLTLSCGIVFFFFSRLWKSRWLILITIFPTTLLYFVISCIIISVTQTGTLNFYDALSFGIWQGIYNILWALILLIIFPKIFVK
ncbi:MAG: hypothetical protein ACP5RW_02365 [bacterium]